MQLIKRIGLFLLVNIAVILLFSLITSILGLDGYLTHSGIDYTSLLVFAAIFGFAGSFISLMMSRWMAKKTFNIAMIETPKSDAEQKIYDVVSRISVAHNITLPEMGIYESSEVNAFATGWSKNHSLVAVSTGLLKAMNEDEVEGVVAHEMAHILNGDMVTMTLLQGVMNTFIIFFARIVAYAIQSFMGRGDEDGVVGGFAYYGISMALEVLLGLLAGLVISGFSRYREYRADAGSAKYVGTHKMIAALQKLQKMHEMVDPKQKAFATMKISGGGIRKLYSTHPPLEKRIAALMGSTY